MVAIFPRNFAAEFISFCHCCGCLSTVAVADLSFMLPSGFLSIDVVKFGA